MLAGSVSRRSAYLGGARRDRRRRRCCSGSALFARPRRRAARPPAARRTSRSRPSRRSPSSRASARSHPSSRRRAGSRSSSATASLAARVPAARDRRHRRAALGWLRWATPLGWSEERAPFAGARPAVLIAAGTRRALLLVVAGLIARDATSAPGCSARATPRGRACACSRPRPRWLCATSSARSPCGWPGSASFAAIVGILSTSFTNANLPASLRRAARASSAARRSRRRRGAIGFYFLLFVLTISLFACSQIACRAPRGGRAAARDAVRAPGRPRAAGSPAGCSWPAAGARCSPSSPRCCAWAGAAAENADVSPPSPARGRRELPAGDRSSSSRWERSPSPSRRARRPASPTASSAVAFVWQLLGALLGAPHWLLDLSPFQHIALVPAQPFRARRRAMLALAAVAVLPSLWSFGRRDLTGA